MHLVKLNSLLQSFGLISNLKDYTFPVPRKPGHCQVVITAEREVNINTKYNEWSHLLVFIVTYVTRSHRP